jgi:RimJ/RimL family protein N-acetyltransferase
MSPILRVSICADPESEYARSVERALLDAGAQPRRSAPLLSMLQEHTPDWVLVDAARLDSGWHDHVRTQCGGRIAVIDRGGHTRLSPDLLIDLAGCEPSRLDRHPLRCLRAPTFALPGAAARIALALFSLAGRLPELRAISPADARQIWLWRNHPATRALSRNSAEIPWEQHLAWLEGHLGQADRLFFIGRLGRQEIGVIRFDELAGEPGAYEVSLYLDPSLHGLGLGTGLLRAGEQALAERPGACEIRAEVLDENASSLALFRAAGYRPLGPNRFGKRLLLREA